MTPPMTQVMKQASTTYVDYTPHYPNPLVVAAANYSYVPLRYQQHFCRRRPKKVLNDSDDPFAIAISRPTRFHKDTPHHITDLNGNVVQQQNKRVLALSPHSMPFWRKSSVASSIQALSAGYFSERVASMNFGLFHRDR